MGKQRHNKVQMQKLEIDLDKTKLRLQKLVSAKQNEINKINAKYDARILETETEIKNLNVSIQEEKQEPLVENCITCNKVLISEYMDKKDFEEKCASEFDVCIGCDAFICDKCIISCDVCKELHCAECWEDIGYTTACDNTVCHDCKGAH